MAPVVAGKQPGHEGRVYGDLYEPAPDGLSDGMRAVDRAQLLEDRLQAFLDRDLAAVHGDADLAIGGALAGAAQDLAIVVGEIRVPHGLLAREVAELLEDPIQQFGAEL